MRRHKPIISNSFTGGGLVSLFGGYRGKYLKNSSLDLVSSATARAKDNTSSSGQRAKASQAFDPNEINSSPKPLDNSNPLELMPHPSGNMTENNQEIAKPKFNKGNLSVDFIPAIDDKGNNISGTLEIGIIGKDGTINVLQKIESDSKTTIKADFDLKPGETISIKNSEGSGYNAKATKDTGSKNESKKKDE